MFDGACPLCRAEVAMYQKQAGPDASLRWIDVSAEHTTVLGEPDLACLRRRFHVRTAQGQWLSGAAAFAHLWDQLPGWRLLARLARWPGMLCLMEGAYRVFLCLRPGMQAVMRRLTGPDPTRRPKQAEGQTPPESN
jgi:predicted DCC family thiol-disulfide oxidoreductase YuxK